jgi:hypothetical protein
VARDLRYLESYIETYATPNGFVGDERERGGEKRRSCPAHKDGIRLLLLVNFALGCHNKHVMEILNTSLLILHSTYLRHSGQNVFETSQPTRRIVRSNLRHGSKETFRQQIENRNCAST